MKSMNKKYNLKYEKKISKIKKKKNITKIFLKKKKKKKSKKLFLF